MPLDLSDVRPGPLELYRSHKLVQAAKILNITQMSPEDPCLLHFADHGVIHVSNEYLQRHHPQVGGYYVRYEDGYESFSPDKAFEDGYISVPRPEYAGLGTRGYPLENNFTYHPPFGTQQARYVALRDFALRLAKLIEAYTPPSREQSLAFTKLEESIMWANASIARNEKKPE